MVGRLSYGYLGSQRIRYDEYVPASDLPEILEV